MTQPANAPAKTPPPAPSGKKQGCGGRAFFTSKKGKRYYAKDYGYHCWPFGGNSDNPKK